MTTSLKTVRRAVKRFHTGCECHYRDMGFEKSVTLLSPPKHVWRYNNSHVIMAETYHPFEINYTRVLQQMGAGIIQCHSPKCEWCK